ncbi:MAG: phosphoribosylformylglycinamidine cyclo-ligase [Acidimicrobiia bacterium]|nr:phosphoribosylformylglycinamidine cyclo-ligase [Acidimicrobiia bacterium]
MSLTRPGTDPAARPAPAMTYRDAGVDIDAANAAVAGMAAAVRRTYTPRVLSEVGSFGGLFSAADLGREPVLVASTDGVGTKVKLAADRASYRSVGHDLVNHCVNDILVQGARPLFFLDYVAAATLDPAAVVEVVTGIAEACEAVGAALLGGETAEMPGVYTPGSLDVAGTIVGVVERGAILPRPEEMAVGDVLVALASSGPHTNGYSLIRHLLARQDHVEPAFVDSLLVAHRCYLDEVQRWLAAGVELKGLAHITGGGLVENLPRVLADGLGAIVDTSSWPVPEPFATLVRWGAIADDEAYRAFNMGVGMVAIVGADQVDELRAVTPEAFPIGRLDAGTGVTLR